MYDRIGKPQRNSVNTNMEARPDKDDHELLRLIQEGNSQAFALLVERHTDRFYRLAYRYLQNREAAEDTVQDAFLKLWENPALWQPERNSRFTTWFYRVVINLCLDARRRKTPLPLEDEAAVPDERQPAEEKMIREEEQEALERAIGTLPERQRTALNLCFDEGLTNQQAAEVMGLKLKALQSLIMRAKTTLKERMKDYL